MHFVQCSAAETGKSQVSEMEGSVVSYLAVGGWRPPRGDLVPESDKPGASVPLQRLRIWPEVQPSAKQALFLDLW